MVPIDIIYQDDHLVAINKPSGLIVHRSYVARGEKIFALQLVRDAINQYVFPVHRLDRPTSGVLLFALSSEIARKMTERFTNRQVEKSYLAIVRGFTEDNGKIDYALKEMADRKADHAIDPNKPPQEAHTEYEKIAQIELPYAVGRYETARYSLIRVCPKTGRNHQVRRHLAYISHPVIGDSRHGDRQHNRFYQKQFNISRLLLVCSQIRFRHPYSNESVAISADPGSEFQSLVDQFKWKI